MSLKIKDTLNYECPVCEGNIDEILDFDHFGDYECPHCFSSLFIGINSDTHQFIIQEERKVVEISE